VGSVLNNRFEQTVTDVRAIILEAMTGYSPGLKRVAMFERSISVQAIASQQFRTDLPVESRDLVPAALHVTWQMIESFSGFSLSSFLKYVGFVFSDPDVLIVLTNAIDPGIERSSIDKTQPSRRMKAKGGSLLKILIKPKEDTPTRRSGQSAGCITPIFGGRVTNQVGCTSNLSKQAQHQIVEPIDLHMQVDITILSRFGSGR
jgi:hypothetical protein